MVAISGRNGKGKTNLLDAIYYLCFTRSYFARSDSQAVSHGLAGMRLEADVRLLGNQHQLICIIREQQKKEILVDGEPYKRFSDHIGRFPAVMIAPDDVRLISGASEERRNYLDTLLSQIDHPYLLLLIDHNKLLQQRNSLLKQSSESGFTDHALLDVLDSQLVTKGTAIYEARSSLVTQLLPLAISIYQRIAGTEDLLTLAYESSLSTGDYASLLHNARSRDLILQRTGVGIHRDELVFQLNGFPFRQEASQGQRKSLLFALKLAEWQLLWEHKGFAPILLLDDVFEKLDAQRMENLLAWVASVPDCQVFITDTHRERLEMHLGKIGRSFEVVELGEHEK